MLSYFIYYWARSDSECKGCARKRKRLDGIYESAGCVIVLCYCRLESLELSRRDRRRLCRGLVLACIRCWEISDLSLATLCHYICTRYVSGRVRCSLSTGAWSERCHSLCTGEVASPRHWDDVVWCCGKKVCVDTQPLRWVAVVWFFFYIVYLVLLTTKAGAS